MKPTLTLTLTFAAALSSLAIPVHAAAPWRPLDPARTLVIDTTKGRIVVEMQPGFAPLAVARVTLLAREHLYDGLLFHCLIDHYVGQTGNPNNHDGGTSNHPNLPPEFRTPLKPSAIDAIATQGGDGISGFVGATPFAASPDPAHPGLWRAWAAYCEGMAGMGREADPASANSEIFFMRAASRSLDHDYTPWGRVIAGRRGGEGTRIASGPRLLSYACPRLHHSTAFRRVPEADRASCRQKVRR